MKQTKRRVRVAMLLECDVYLGTDEDLIKSLRHFLGSKVHIRGTDLDYSVTRGTHLKVQKPKKRLTSEEKDEWSSLMKRKPQEVEHAGSTEVGFT